MTWRDDLRHIDWNGRKYLVLDIVKEEGRTYLGLAPFEAVSEAATAMDAGRSRPLPSRLSWVEETMEGFFPLSRKASDQILKRKRERAAEAFRRQ